MKVSHIVSVVIAVTLIFAFGTAALAQRKRPMYRSPAPGIVDDTVTIVEATVGRSRRGSSSMPTTTEVPASSSAMHRSRRA